MPTPASPALAGRPQDERWPPLPLAPWQDTLDTLHMWTQIVGKLKVERAPFLNQFWQTALHLTARGLTTQPIPRADGGVFQVDFDFVDHNLIIVTDSGGNKTIPLYPRTVASFYEETLACLAALGIAIQIDPMPQEIPDPIPFPEDTKHHSYDPDAVHRWWQILTASAGVMWQQRSWFVGKASPIQFFWGTFDLSATRFNGDPVPVPPDKGYLYRVAENEANWAAGFWPGSGAVDYPAYYAYMVPPPGGLPDAAIEPDAAFWSAEMGEFILPYETVRTAADPAGTLLAFLQSTYAASADLAGWDRETLEIREIPRPR